MENAMKMIVMDEAFARNPEMDPKMHSFAVDNPQYIPRVGEKVVMPYEPTPKVLAVVWDFAKCTIYVVVG